MEKRFAPTHDAGGEAELADQRFQIFCADAPSLEEARHVAEQVLATVFADGHRARFGVDDQAQVRDASGWALLLVRVAAEAEPAEHRDCGSHVGGALLVSLCGAYQIVHVHAGRESNRGEELDHLASQAAGEGGRHFEAERHARAASVGRVALAVCASRRLPLEPRCGGRAGAAPRRVGTRVTYPARLGSGRA